MRAKKIYRKIKPSKVKGLGNDRPSSGFSYIIIPNDIDRDEYIREYYKTGFCMMITSFNEIIKNIKVPQHLLQQIVFPQEVDGYGSLVSWNNVPVSNQVIVTGIHQKPGEIFSYREDVNVDKHTINGQVTISQTTDLNTKSRIVSVRSEDGSKGSLSFSCKSETATSQFTMYTDGKIKLVADDNVDVVIENELKIQIGTSKDQIGTLTVDNQGKFEYIDKNDNYFKIDDGVIQLDALTINIGKQASQPAVLGTEIKDILSELLGAIQKLTFTNSAGPTAIPNNVAEFQGIQSKLTNILSKKTKIE